MKLYFREFGTYRERRPTLIFLHGLFGSAANWQTVARGLEERFHVLVPDLRNHGRSPHAEAMDYPLMANDVASFIDEQGLDSALLIGHSMGGKVAMWLALVRPELVGALVAVDIAPVAYSHEFDNIFQALNAVDLGRISGRAQADGHLAGFLTDPALRQYLLQNLVNHDGSWGWRFNLQVLMQAINRITGFPDISPSMQFPGPALFLHGGVSEYLKPAYLPIIRQRFPLARVRSIPGAGHWVYAERPVEFRAALNTFLDSAIGLSRTS